MTDTAYTLVYEEFRTLLEKGKDDAKIEAMKRILIIMLNGDAMSDLLMHIIRFVMPSKSKELKKLLYFYWEICPKLNDDGKLKQEMILVCNAIQHDLQHPNEFIRGNTLRFLNKLKEPDLLEPLIPNVRQCLEHRHAYVRKNAVFAIYSIYKVSDHLVPDADELITNFLSVETDSICKRNAFVCLGNLNRELALQYIQDNVANIASLDGLLQLAFIEFIRKDSVVAPQLREQYAQLVEELVESSSNVVVFEAATTLTALSSLSSSVGLSAQKFLDIAIKEPNNNVKLIALDRIRALHLQNPGLLNDLALDVLRILTSQDLDVRKKALDVALDLISSRNVEEVVKLLKNELEKTANSDEDKTSDYRTLLINTIHQLAIKFVEVAVNVVDLLLEFMSELNTAAATEVIIFVKEVVEKFPDLRSSIIKTLIASLTNVKSGKVYRGSLWIIGEYCVVDRDIQEAWKHIRSAIGEVPILASEKKKAHSGDESEEKTISNGSNNSTRPVVLADGTYATENAFTSSDDKNGALDDSTPPIRKLILEGDFYLAAVLSSTLVKLVLRFKAVSTNSKILNALQAEALLIMVSILRVGESNLISKKIDEDSAERILGCIKFLTDDETVETSTVVQSAFLEDTKNAYKQQVEKSDAQLAESMAKDFQKNAQQADDSIVFRQLAKDAAKNTDLVEEDLSRAAGSDSKKENLSSRLDKVLPLTGFSDPIYAEAYIKVHQFDVVLDVLLVNQTTATLRNLSVEFATLGDLKVVDKPTTHNIGPHGFHRVQTTIKVTSADTGVIFGNIVYDGQHSDDSTIVILNDVHVDIMDYIKPATTTETSFRQMWNEFEWENKITIKSALPSLKSYLDTLLENTNMNCLTPSAVIGEECQFLSANLYSKSSFGEDALANLCIEKKTDGPIVGHVRIRSKGQGLALSLGDRVAAIARKTNKATISKV